MEFISIILPDGEMNFQDFFSLLHDFTDRLTSFYIP